MPTGGTTVPNAVESLGEHIWLLSTDYPHQDTPWPDGVSLVAARKMSESAKIKMFWENAKRFLPWLTGVKLPATQAEPDNASLTAEEARLQDSEGSGLDASG